MDRGLLSSPRLLEASRKFVCARLVTYESPKEGVFLKSIGATRTGGVPNTTFVLLARVEPLLRARQEKSTLFEA